MTVVICAYTDDRWDDTVAAVRSVGEQEEPVEQVVVVVDHNPPLAVRLTAALPGVEVLENAGGRGLAEARNTGVAAAAHEVVAFLDDDAAAPPDWARRLRDAYRDPAVVAVGGAADADWDGPPPRWFPAEFSWVVGCSWRGLPTAPEPVRNLIGCNMSFRAELFADDAFTHGIGRVGRRPVGCEETELCIRVRQRRPEAVILYDPSIRIRHRVSPDRHRLSYFVRRCHAEGISKALVADLVGPGDGLASERHYTRRVLPAGVRAGVTDGFRGDASGLARAGAIVLGLTITAAGYARGTATLRMRRRPPQTAAEAPTDSAACTTASP